MLNRTSKYILFVCCCAVLSAQAVYIVGVGNESGQALNVLFLATIVVIAELLPSALPRAAVASIAFFPLLAIVLIAPGWIGLLAIGAASCVVQLRRRRAFAKATFNIAQTVLSTSSAMLVYQVAGVDSYTTLRNSSLLLATQAAGLSAILAITTYLVVNNFVVFRVIALDQNKTVMAVWRENKLSTVAYDVLAIPPAFVFSWFFVHYGALGAAALALPLIGTRQLYSTILQLAKVNHELLELMIKAIEARDPYTSGHSRRVAHYSEIVARAIGLEERQIERVKIAALLHDAGKIHEIYAPILRKPDKLTPEEWEIMKTHPVKSAELVATVSHLRDLIAPVRHHHENWDGTGYPDGLAGEAIPLASRVIMFADTTDAMTTNRPYRRPLGEVEVRAELLRCRGKQFDPEMCDRLLTSPLFRKLFEGAPDGGRVEAQAEVIAPPSRVAVQA